MNVLNTLEIPLIIAPMAGGPSTPALVHAAARAGGMGFLATGSIDAETTARRIDDCAAVRFGINLFAPQPPLEDLGPVRDFMAEIGLQDAAVPEVDYSFGYREKLDAVLAAKHKPAVLSLMFGLFSEEDIRLLHEAGIEAWVVVTNPDDARRAEQRGVDAIIVQGSEAGGHRGTWDITTRPDPRTVLELLDDIDVEVPVIAAGGVNEDTIAGLLGRADAVMAGSAFLLSDEAGTSAMSRELLRAGGTVVTSRGFSGRYARGLETKFIREHTVGAIYPFVNPLLKPKRANPAYAYCLVGTHLPRHEGSAEAIFARLARAAGYWT